MKNYKRIVPIISCLLVCIYIGKVSNAQTYSSSSFFGGSTSQSSPSGSGGSSTGGSSTTSGGSNSGTPQV